jgi:hypothetical protein
LEEIAARAGLPPAQIVLVHNWYGDLHAEAEHDARRQAEKHARFQAENAAREQETAAWEQQIAELNAQADRFPGTSLVAYLKRLCGGR